MKIFLKKESRSEFQEIEIESGTTIEQIYKKIKDECPYIVTCAKVDNKTKTLTYKLDKPEAKVELLDVRTQMASIIYQNSLCLLYFKAVRDVLGDVNVEIENSMSKGLYTKFSGDIPVTESDLMKIQNRMEEMVAKDIPIVRRKMTVKEARELVKGKDEEDYRLLLQRKDNKNIQFYTLENYVSYFSYEYMVPSTGYITKFELRRYQDGVILRYPVPSSPDRIPKFVDDHVLFEIYKERDRWCKLMNVKYVSDVNNAIETGEFKHLILLSEALHEHKICEIADQITRLRKRIILIAGPSSSGKTTFAKRLCVQLKVNGLDPLYMGTDDYFVEREQTPVDDFGEKDYENLEAVDVKLFNENMNDLLAGKEVDLPTFNFMTGHKEYGQRITKMKPGQVLVVEGIHALNEKMTYEISHEDKFKIYISPLTAIKIDNHNRVVTTDHRMLRRMVRDFKYRGHSAEETLREWPKVRAGEDKNIFPFANEADAMFNSVHIYEIPILKKYVEPLLLNIKPEEPEYGDAKRMLRFLSFFETFEDDSIIANNSILREFIGGSIFVD